jgi:hypothetical protein
LKCVFNHTWLPPELQTLVLANNFITIDLNYFILPPKVTVFHAQENSHVHGVLNCSGLESIDMTNNQLRGLHANCYVSSKLVSLILNRNIHLKWEWRNFFEMKNLQILEAGNTQMDPNSLSFEFFHLPHLRSLKLDGNKLRGQVLWEKFENLTSLTLSKNQLSGVVNATMKTLDLSNNLFCGNVEPIADLVHWDLSDNPNVVIVVTNKSRQKLWDGNLRAVRIGGFTNITDIPLALLHSLSEKKNCTQQDSHHTSPPWWFWLIIFMLFFFPCCILSSCGGNLAMKKSRTYRQLSAMED